MFLSPLLSQLHAQRHRRLATACSAPLLSQLYTQRQGLRARHRPSLPSQLRARQHRHLCTYLLSVITNTAPRSAASPPLAAARSGNGTLAVATPRSRPWRCRLFGYVLGIAAAAAPAPRIRQPPHRSPSPFACRANASPSNATLAPGLAPITHPWRQSLAPPWRQSLAPKTCPWRHGLAPITRP